MKNKNKKLIPIIVGMGIPLLILATLLNVMSYRRMIAETFVHSCNLNTSGAVRKINYAISFGKSVDKFYGLEDVLDSTMNLSEDITGIAVRTQDGTTVEHVGESCQDIEVSDVEEYIITDEGIYSFVPFDTGTMVLRLNQRVVSQNTKEYALWVAQVDLCLLVLLLLGTAIVCLGLYRDRVLSAVQLKRWSLILLVGSQVILGGSTTWKTVTSYQSSVTEISQSVAKVVENDIEEVLHKGIAYEEVTGITDYLRGLASDIPELSSITLQEDDSSSLTWAQRVQCHISQKQINRKIMNNAIDVLILVMVTVLLSMEVIGFITTHLAERKNRVKGELYLPCFRLFVFASGLTFSLDCGFISILSNQLYTKMAVGSQYSFLCGLPNTMYSAAVVIGLLGCSFLISKLGMGRTMMLGILMGIVGYILCAIAVSLPMLIAARFIFGFCDGLVLNTIRLYASAQKDAAMHTKLLVTYFAAINLGVCCSVVIGGLIADVTSYTMVFLIGAVLGVCCLILAKLSGFPNEKTREKMSFLAAVKQLRIMPVLFFMLCVVIPIYIATLYVGYTFPLFGDEIGFSNSMISGCLMVNYLLVAYLTDPLSAWVMKRISVQRATIIYVICQAASIGVFVLIPNVWTAILALVLTSVWDSFGMVVIDSVLDGVKGTTTERSTLLQMLCGKIGMIIGPMIVTAGLGAGAAAATMSIVVILIGGMIFYLLSKLPGRMMAEKGGSL